MVLAGFIFFREAAVLKATIIIDYQNMHLTGSMLFNQDWHNDPKYLNPIMFCEELIKVRNSRVPDETLRAEILRIEVFRGL